MALTTKQRIAGTGLGVSLLFLTACAGNQQKPNETPAPQPTTSTQADTAEQNCINPTAVMIAKPFITGACGLVGGFAGATTGNPYAILGGTGGGVYFCNWLLDQTPCTDEPKLGQPK